MRYFLLFLITFVISQDPLSIPELVDTPYTETYTFDGNDNNKNNRMNGCTGTPLETMFGHHYSDNSESMEFSNRPSCCSLEKYVLTPYDIYNMYGLSSHVMAFGQFTISHDCAHTAGTEKDIYEETECGFPLKRNKYIKGTSPRQHPNTTSAWMDLSQVYGQTSDKAARLSEDPERKSGRLRVQANSCQCRQGFHLEDDYICVSNDCTRKDGCAETYSTHLCLPPDNCEELGIVMGTDVQQPQNKLYCVGDVRGNENLMLLINHVLFLREHNRLADEIRALKPSWDHDKIFMTARSLNIAQMQNIVYYEYSKAMLGETVWEENKMGQYNGYDDTLSPQTFEEFAQVIFRFPHAQITNEVWFVNEEGETSKERLFEFFFHPGQVASRELEGWVRGMNAQPAQEVGLQYPSDLIKVEFDYGPVIQVHLLAVDCLRGRDVGALDYKSFREKLGMPIEKLDDITKDVRSQKMLKEEYLSRDPTLGNIDLFLGGLVEDHVPGSPLGPTFVEVFKKQLLNIRDSDRFWFERTFSDPRLVGVLPALRKASLSRIILNNTNIECMQSKAFYQPFRSPKLCKDKSNLNLIQQIGGAEGLEFLLSKITDSNHGTLKGMS
eukprot:GHVL01024217.1.p1 GENE.GHVL01024217.1~~GHVL01024217.1.p1  ORF type:complete len:609 (+),score=84.90 GHVL01024217.1:77-1903(+)